jgi:hypothetical protein
MSSKTFWNPHSIALLGAAPAKSTPRTSKPRYVVIHPHGFSSNIRRHRGWCQSLARSIQQTHFRRGWIDSGHNFLVSSSGICLEGRHGTVYAIERGKCVLSAHAPGANDSPGIECEGQFSKVAMGDKQWHALVKLVTAICKLTGIASSNIKGHRDFNKTECPGNWLYNQLPRLRAEIAAALTDEAIENTL